MKIFKRRVSVIVVLISLLSLSTIWTGFAFAHSSPSGCTGSGLGINLFSNLTQVHVGDVISYGVVVFNGVGSGPPVCDATGIQASLVTPDGVNHPIVLTRTTLASGESDFYPNVVTYTAATADINPVNGILAATASDTGIIHQNVTDSAGGANQGLNVFVLNTLHVVKLVVNNSGGTAVASDFTVHVKNAGADVTGSPASASGAPGTAYELIAGTYTVSENASTAYAQSFGGDCDATGTVSLLAGDNKTCTVTNDDIPPASIKVIKTVINDDGGTKTVADFPLFVNGQPDTSGDFPILVSTPVVSGVATVFPAPADYTITETVDPNYTQTFSGDCDAAGNISIVPGDIKTCTITNDDIPPAAATINVVKTVINDNGGTKVVADFPLLVNTSPVVSGATNVFPAGTYHVTETVDPNYTQTFSGDCDAAGQVILTPGDNMFCIITNDDIPPPPVVTATPTPSTGGGGGSSGGFLLPVPPLIDVVKVPDPLALPNGPGLVTYTYTVRNIGTVPMTNVTMVGDSCSPITLISGDTNGDAKLDLTETWKYTCSTTLSATHTNTVVATGWANSISAIDIANARVVVGVPVVPPLIHVTKVPNPLLLLAGGGTVTYTERISNPGTVALSNVNLTDDKCAPLTYVSGDTNRDSLLDPSETWTYTCQTRLTRSTTNTAIASGQANGLTIRDFAVATVVVGVPGLPNTGIPPDEKGIPWNFMIPAGIFITLVSTYLVRRKHVLTVLQ